MIDVRARLTAADLPEQLARLGFRGPDAPDALAAVVAAAASETDLARVEVLARQLLARIGNFAFAGVENPLTAEDIADCVAWVSTRPHHVNVDRLVVRPLAQAAQHKVHRQQ